MAQLYRLRSMDRLIGNSQELEKQTIYFASAEELNDPMEGFRDIFWQGDRIAWTNLFRHYLYCFHKIYVHFRIAGEIMELRPHHIPVMSDPSQNAPPKAVSLFEDICGRVFQKASLNEFIAKIVSAKRKARHDEMLFYLQSLHHIALQEIQDSHIDHGLASNDERRKTFPTGFKHVHKMLDLMPQSDEKRSMDVLFARSSRMMEDVFIRHKYNLALGSESESTESESKKNRQLLVYDFPRVYLKQLERLLYPDWYVACFMKDYRNSSTWANYGDKHQGACLVFGAETTSGRSSLTLNKITGYSNNGELWRRSPMNFHEVKYGNKAGEIDFFRSLGELPEPKLREVWYSDKDGNLSECSNHLRTNTDAWRKDHWAGFYPALFVKTTDWKHEQETRLILFSLLGDISEPRCRRLTYDFSSLKGIIFGIRTPETDKLKIIETIHKKCRQNNRTDFEFFQAYHCHETGRIQKYGLNLKFSV